MEPHDGLLHPTSSWISIVPRKIDDNEHAEHERSLLRTALTDNPEWLIGRQAHKFFPEWMGTCRAEVTGYDSKTKLWTVTYEADGVSEEFDYEDMNKYVIDRICGTAPADGGAPLELPPDPRARSPLCHACPGRQRGVPGPAGPRR